MSLGALGFGLGLGDIFTSLFSGMMNYSSALQTNSQVKRMMRENRAWMKNMSDTAHQREVADLRRAHLNPILSAGGLQGASTPNISTPGLETPTLDLGSPGKSMMGNLSSAVDIANRSANTELQKAQTEEVNSATALNRAKTITEQHEAMVRSAEAKFAEASKFYGKEKAGQEYRKALADADVATANAFFRLSPSGHSAYVHNEWNKAFKGIHPVTYPLMQIRQMFGGANESNASPSSLNPRNFHTIFRTPR